MATLAAPVEMHPSTRDMLLALDDDMLIHWLSSMRGPLACLSERQRLHALGLIREAFSIGNIEHRQKRHSRDACAEAVENTAAYLRACLRGEDETPADEKRVGEIVAAALTERAVEQVRILAASRADLDERIEQLALAGCRVDAGYEYTSNGKHYFERTAHLSRKNGPTLLIAIAAVAS